MMTPKFKKIAALLIAISAIFVDSAHPQAARTVMVNSNTGVLLFPTNLWSANAANARSGLSLGSAATNPASAFQPSSTILSNLASSNGAGLTNLTAANVTGTVALASNVTGTIAISNGGTGATNAAAARANLDLGATWLTNTNVTNFLSSVGLGTTDDVTFDNVYLQGGAVKLRGFAGKFLVDSVSLPIAEFSTALTLLYSNVQIRGSLEVSNASVTRTNLGLGATWLTNTNVTNFRSDIGLGSAATNLASAFQPSSSVLSNLANNNGASLTNITVSNLGTIPVVNGGTGATNAVAARTNLGLGATWLTNTNAGAFLSAINGQSSLIDLNVSAPTQVGRGHNDGSFVAFGSMGLYISAGLTNIDDEDAVGNLLFYTLTNPLSESDGVPQGTWSVHEQDKFRNAINLGAAWLTNTNNPVFVSTNGAVVSPTNFWQVAPIQALVQSIISVTNSTNAATNARNLYIYSLATNIINVTNTVTLPTNTSSFDGDEVTVIHRGGSNSVTAVRQLGSTNNLISLNSYDESVKFIKDGNWDFYHNISFTEAIKFSGTNVAANAGASRTNLGLGATNDVQFNTVNARGIFDGTNEIIDIENNWLNYVGFGATFEWNDTANTTYVPFAFGGTNSALNAATTRTNLGLGATNVVAFADIEITKTGTNSVYAKNDAGSFQVQIGTNAATFAVSTSSVDIVPSIIAYSNVSVDGDIDVAGVISVTNAAATRTNLGIPLAALTNTSATNFQKAIFYTNTAPSNIGGNLGSIAAWIEIVASNGVTYKIPAYTNVP